ncbi:MAG: hypothetical protein N3B10_03915 [Armatimonadetes bacterium]|nr:hypothetical protein [Armatimonadota bacterium]MCX7967622.1 hypothetical protein [Armatimonadota bacterium]MDW8142863.1 hypothetical protein [Armatimonadota bacterium]
MRWGAFLLVCAGFAILLVGVRAEQRAETQSYRWARQMMEYCEDLADSFERLESYHKALAKQFQQSKRRRLAELHEKLADEHDRVADRLNELERAYEQLVKELRR